VKVKHSISEEDMNKCFELASTVYG
jgi:hypothetical protein